MAPQNDPLRAYNEKRNFEVTTEPKGEVGTGGEKPVFVVQKHDATAMHYDFRLEVDGVLVSWAVPKGPSTDPADKRLAMPTEAHPMSYRDFEGVIAAGEYGAGPVIVWDRGTYRHIRDDEDDPDTMSAAVEAGKVEFWLEGEKLQGGYTLVRTNWGGRTKWLLIKKNDEHARPGYDITAEQPASVKSGRTLAEVEHDDSRSGTKPA